MREVPAEVFSAQFEHLASISALLGGFAFTAAT
jgi:hypothetical protein